MAATASNRYASRGHADRNTNMSDAKSRDHAFLPDPGHDVADGARGGGTNKDTPNGFRIMWILDTDGDLLNGMFA